MRWHHGGTHWIETHAWVVGAHMGPHQTLRSVAIRTGDGAAGSHGHLFIIERVEWIHTHQPLSLYARSSLTTTSTTTNASYCYYHDVDDVEEQ